MATIVVMDSEPVVRTAIKRILARAGHAVKTSGDFNQAVEVIRVNSPDLVNTNVCIKGLPGHNAISCSGESFLICKYSWLRVCLTRKS